jgi:hypothetical protein
MTITTYSSKTHHTMGHGAADFNFLLLTDPSQPTVFHWKRAQQYGWDFFLRASPIRLSKNHTHIQNSKISSPTNKTHNPKWVPTRKVTQTGRKNGLKTHYCWDGVHAAIPVGERGEWRAWQAAEYTCALNDKITATKLGSEAQTRWLAVLGWLCPMVISIQQLEMTLRIDLNSP